MADLQAEIDDLRHHREERGMSVRKLRAELKDFRGKIEPRRRPVSVLVEIGETEGQALICAGVDIQDPKVDVSFIGSLYPEERGI